MKHDLLRGLSGKCSCGMDHQVSVRKVVMDENGLSLVPQIMEELSITGNGILVCDNNTYQAAGEKLKAMLPSCCALILPAHDLHANESGIALLEKRVSDEDFLIAVGSGTIHDITRYVAEKKKIPFLSVPTAASVDGFVSNSCALVLEGLKVSVPAAAPVACILDLSVLAAAPLRLTAAGLGDLLGKYTAMADWKIGRLFTQEYYCERIAKMQYDAIDRAIKAAPKLKDGDLDAYAILAEGLILSGLAMQLTGITRPASGAEHYVSHFIEMGMAPSCRKDALHGEKVGVGLVMVSQVYHTFAQLPVKDWLGNKEHRLSEKELFDIFGKVTSEVMWENRQDVYENTSIEDLQYHLKDIVRFINEIPKPEELERILKLTDASTTPEELGLSLDDEIRTYRYSSYVRNRATLMKLLTKFGIVEQCINFK